MNAIDILLAAVLAAALLLAVRHSFRARKKGCGGNCASCGLCPKGKGAGER